MKVKICGITGMEDAAMCEEEGADALGFIHFSGRRRSLPLSEIKKIIDSIGPMTVKVLVCDPKSAKEASEFARLSGADVLQVYSLQPQELHEFRDSGGKVIRAVKPSKFEAERFAGCADALLFEMGEPGTGTSYDYSTVPTDCCRKAIIAGGLRIDNLDPAKAKRPYALDVSSGVEIVPGRKDRGLVAEFIRRCKE